LNIVCYQTVCTNCPADLREFCSRSRADGPIAAGLLDRIDERDPKLGALVLAALWQLARTKPAPTIEDVYRLFAVGMPYSRHRRDILGGPGND
jgi:hypothetical protein